MAQSFLDQYDKGEGLYAQKTPSASDPEKKGVIATIAEKLGISKTEAPAVTPPVQKTYAPSLYDQAAGIPGRAPSFIDQYESRTGMFSGAESSVHTTPDEARTAGMASFLDRTPETVRTAGESAWKTSVAIPDTIDTPRKPLVSLYDQAKIDDPQVARQFADAFKAQQPKPLVTSLKDSWNAYNDHLGRFSEGVALGETATLQSFIGAIEWLSPNKKDGTPGNIKAGAKDVGDRLGAWMDAASKSQGDQTFTDQLAQGIGSSAVFFLPGLGVARGATMLTTVSPRLALLFGGNASAALEAMSEAGNVYRSVIADKNAFLTRNSDVKLSPDQIDADASDAATRTFWANAILLSLTNRFGVFNPDAAGFVRRIVMSAPMEGLQEGVQQIIQNFTQSHAGVGSEPVDLLKGAGSSFIIGAIVGGLMGAGVEHLVGGPDSAENLLKPPVGDAATTQETGAGEAPPVETAQESTPAPEAPETKPQEQAAPSAEAPAPAAQETGTKIQEVIPPESLAKILPEGVTIDTPVRSGQLNVAGASTVRLGDLDTRSLDQAIRETEQDVAEATQRNDAAQKALATSKLDALLKINDLLEEPAATEKERSSATRELTLKPEDLDQQVEVATERIMQKQFQGNEGFRKNATEQARKEVRQNVEVAGQRVQRPEQIVTKTSIRDLVRTIGGDAVFTVAEENGRKVLTFDSKGTKLRIFPRALGLVEENLNVGDTIRMSSEELKGKGSALRAHGSSGGALAFNIKDFSDGVLGSKKGEAAVDKTIARSAIARELAQKLGVPVRSGHFKNKALGIFKPWAHVVRLKSKLGNLRIPVLVHESAHFLDYTMLGEPVKGKAIDNPQNWRTTKFVSSMIPLAELDPLLVEYGGEPKSKKREAFAEFVRYWVTEPAKAAERAPKFKEIWETKILPDFPEVRDALETTRADWQRWNDMPAVAKVVSQISFGERSRSFAELKDAVVETWHDQISQWIDDLHPLKRFSDIARANGVGVNLSEDPYILARLSRGWIGKAVTFLEKGTFGVQYWKTEGDRAVPAFTGEGFKQIMQPLIDAHTTEDFSAYLVARRAIALEERGIHSGVDKGTAQQAFDDLAKAHPEFLDIATKLDAYQDSLLEYIRDSGLLKADTYAMMRKASRDYVPFYRVMDKADAAGLGGRTFADLRSPIKRIKGSDRDIINPLESIVKNTYALINAAERNRVGIAMLNLSRKHPELAKLFEDIPAEQTKVAQVQINKLIEQVSGGQEGMALYAALTDGQIDPNEAQQKLGDLGEKLINIFRPSLVHGDNILTVMVGGTPKSYYVDPQIYRAMQGMDVEDVGMVWKLISYPARWLRAGATLTPEFIVRNPARDLMSAFVYSEYGFMPPIDVARGIYAEFSKDNDYWLWRMGGGEHSMLVSMDRTTLSKTYEDLTKEHSLKKYANPIEDMRILSEFTEKMTRIGEMKKALDVGATPDQAAFSSREVTLDFAKMGSKARAVNMIVAFFNANVQGSVRAIRAFREQPQRTILRTLIGITLPSILLELWNERDPDWEEIPEWQKNLFWMIKVGDTWVRWPKPFELGIIFGSLPERIIESINHNDQRLWTELWTSIKDGATPGWLPTGLLPIIENATNYSFFLDRNIVPDSVENLPAFAQYTSYTSETAKHVGRWLDYSPAKIDNLINGYFAGLGRYATYLIDEATKLAEGKKAPTSPAPTLADIPVIKAFVVRDPVSSSSESLNRFYVKAEQARAARTYYNQLINAGKTDEAQQWYADNMAQIALSPFYEKMRTDIAALRELQNQVRDSAAMPPGEKRLRIDKIGSSMTDLAQKAIEITIKTK